MNPALAFGERVSSFILRDAAHLISNPNSVSISPSNEIEGLFPRATQHGGYPEDFKKPSKRQPKLERRHNYNHLPHVLLEERKVKSDPNAKEDPSHLHSSRLTTNRRHKGNELNKPRPIADIIPPSHGEYFRLADLPPEILTLIFSYEFRRTSGRAPKLLTAFKQNAILYLIAKETYYQVNNFSISLTNHGKKKGIENVEAGFVKLIRHLTIVIPRATQQIIPVSATILNHARIQTLTLQVSTKDSLRVVADSIIPKFSDIFALSVVIKNAKYKIRRDGSTQNRAAILNGFYQALEQINKMLGVVGVLADSGGEKQIWNWEAERKGEGGKRRFVMNVAKKHIKFD